MRKFLLLTALLMTSTVSSAASNLHFFCSQRDYRLNGLQIDNLVLDISDEHPEATMTLTYKYGSPRVVVSPMSYERDDGGNYEVYRLSPKTDVKGSATVTLVVSGNATAHVKSEAESILNCKH
jgi:hypothetical protein